MKKLGNYVVNMEKVYGKGSFALTCQSWSNTQPKIYYACKVIDKKNIQNNKEDLAYMIKRVKQQVNSWKELNHQNIVKFEGCQESKNNLYFFLQLCQQGQDIIYNYSTLQKYIDDHRYDKTGQNQEQIVKFTKQIIRSAMYLFQKGIIHRDIKPQNILLRENTVKLSDFGLARILDPQECKTNTITMTFVGTPIYMAPQVLESKKYTIKCDVWSIGVTIYELITGQLPFKVTKFDKSPVVIVQKIKKGKCEFAVKTFQDRPELKKLVELMVQIDPHKRISIQEAHKFAQSLK